MNQCDGCRRGLPLSETGIHRGEGYDLIACTADRYVEESMTDPITTVRETQRYIALWIDNKGHVIELNTALDAVVAEIERLRADDFQLRSLLAGRVAPTTLYRDDGELSDNSAWPHIDFKRDSARDLHDKLAARCLAAIDAARANIEGEQHD